MSSCIISDRPPMSRQKIAMQGGGSQKSMPRQAVSIFGVPCLAIFGEPNFAVSDTLHATVILNARCCAHYAHRVQKFLITDYMRVCARVTRVRARI